MVGAQLFETFVEDERPAAEAPAPEAPTPEPGFSTEFAMGTAVHECPTVPAHPLGELDEKIRDLNEAVDRLRRRIGLMSR
jgi:hypothetical protein